MYANQPSMAGTKSIMVGLLMAGTRPSLADRRQFWQTNQTEQAVYACHIAIHDCGQIVELFSKPDSNIFTECIIIILRQRVKLSILETCLSVSGSEWKTVAKYWQPFMAVCQPYKACIFLRLLSKLASNSHRRPWLSLKQLGHHRRCASLGWPALTSWSVP